MMDLKEGTPIEMLRQFSEYYNGVLREEFNASVMSLDNQYGKGSIRLYEIMPGITAWIYDINLTSDLDFVSTFSETEVFYFGYNVSGYQLQKFDFEKDYLKIKQSQNFILVGKPGLTTAFKIPEKVPYKCCYLLIYPDIIAESNMQSTKRLQHDLKLMFDYESEKRPYRYFGTIDTKTGTYAETIIENTRTDLIGRLFTEGAIKSMLGSQIESHDDEMKTTNFQPQLTKEELSKITDLGDYILNNLDKKSTVNEMSTHLGMSPKKLQAGIQFLYGFTANEYQNSVRLEYARELIHTTDKSISEICYQIGFSNRSYFSKIFHKHYNVLPSEYKASLNKKYEFYEITYQSIAEKSTTKEDVEQIIETSRKYNDLHGITGCIIYYENYFYQTIEGPKKEILALMKNISKDLRHYDVETLWKGYKNGREFNNWSMATISENGELGLGKQPNHYSLDIQNILEELDQKTNASRNFWAKIRNKIKLSRKDSA